MSWERQAEAEELVRKALQALTDADEVIGKVQITGININRRRDEVTTLGNRQPRFIDHGISDIELQLVVTDPDPDERKPAPVERTPPADRPVRRRQPSEVQPVEVQESP